MLSFWSSFSPWNLEWMYLLHIFHLTRSTLLAYCSDLSVLGLSVSWLLSILLCFRPIFSKQLWWLKIFVPINRLTFPRSLHMKIGNATYWTVLARIFRNTRATCKTGSKFTIKASEKRLWTSFCYFFYYLWIYFNVSIVEFTHVNNGCIKSNLLFILLLFLKILHSLFLSNEYSLSVHPDIILKKRRFSDGAS